MIKRLFNLPGHYKKVRAFHSRYERFLFPVMLLLGFLFDYITFATVQVLTSLIFLLAYWFIVGLAIIFISFYDSGRLPLFFERPRLIISLGVQFLLGALLSGSMVFYWFSGTLSVSWPFILLIALLMVFIDVFRSYFLKPVVQISLYYFITLSLCILTLPLLFNSISGWLFLLAGGLSLVIFLPYVWLLSVINPLLQKNRLLIFVIIFVIFATMNALYAANIIPPIPLSIREAGVYHNVKVSSGKYTILKEPETFWQAIIPGQTLHVSEGQKLYVYSAIFAPTTLNTAIIHHWQYYNAATKTWIDIARSPFNIVGGRQQGYKGYSWITNPSAGKWRVFVETPRGQVLGKISFIVEPTDQLLQLQEIIR